MLALPGIPGILTRGAWLRLIPPHSQESHPLAPVGFFPLPDSPTLEAMQLASYLLYWRQFKADW